MPSRFDAVADELYALPRDEFTSARTERAKEAKSRAPDLAERVGGLRKPTVAAWLVNQVSRQHAEEVGHLADLGSRLRSAHRELAGDELRALSRERNELVRQLSRRAAAIARQAGESYRDTTMRQVEATFEAAVSTADAAEVVRAGRLAAALEPSSSQDWLASAPAGSPKKKTPSKKAASKKASKKAKPPARRAAPEKDPEVARRRAAIDEAEAKASATARELDEARRRADEASARADAAAATVTELRERLDQAVKEEKALRAERTAARRAATGAEKRATEARRRLNEMTSFGKRGARR